MLRGSSIIDIPAERVKRHIAAPSDSWHVAWSRTAGCVTTLELPISSVYVGPPYSVLISSTDFQASLLQHRLARISITRCTE